MSNALRGRPVLLAGAGNGGVPGRRAVIRWAWRLSRREWRQQALIVALLGAAVAVTIVGVAAAASAPADLNAATHGAANGALILPGADPHLAADIAVIKRQYAIGPIEVIQNKTVPVPGSVATIDLRAQDPHGPYGRPMLALVSGHYPTGPGEVAVTSGVASLFNLHIGGLWHEGGLARRVVGVVENPANLRDQFALAAPGQLTAPTQVTLLFQENPRAFFGRGSGPHFPGGAQPLRAAPTVRNPAPSLSPAGLVLVLAVFGLIFIGLVAVAGFTVMAQRRLRALGMLAAAGATDRNIRLVMLAGGAIAGIAGTLIGAALGLAAWAVYAPRLQASAGHVIDPFHLPWPVIATAMALAVASATAAAWRPARTAARIPVVMALSGRPAPLKPPHRLAVAAIILLATGLGLLASSGGWAELGTGAGSGGWATATVYGGTGTLLLAAGIVVTTVGALLLAPLAVAAPAAVARCAPVAVRLALRDLGRYRTRSAAALAAVSFAVFLAVLTCIVATASYANPLTFAGPNLAPSQLIVYEPNTIGRDIDFNQPGQPPTQAQQHALAAKVASLAASLHARFALALYSAGRLADWCTGSAGGPAAYRCGALAANQTNQRSTLSITNGTLTRDAAFRAASVDYQGPLYVATPALLHAYGIKPSQIGPDTDILTSRTGLATVRGLRLLGQGDIVTHMNPPGHEVSQTYQCPPGSCAAHPKVQIFTGLPTGTSAPSTVITEHAVHALGQQLVPDGWLIQTATPLSAGQINTARQMALAAGTRIETSSGQPSLSQIKDGATAAGLLLALAVLAMTAGLMRAETASDLRTLAAAGASTTTRRTLAAATAGALGLLGALIGTATAYLAVIAWAHASLATTLNPVPAAGLTAILAGLPLAATIGGWLLAGRQPPAVARQPLE